MARLGEQGNSSSSSRSAAGQQGPCSHRPAATEVVVNTGLRKGTHFGLNGLFGH
jgi:hypothetical protein